MGDKMKGMKKKLALILLPLLLGGCVSSLPGSSSVPASSVSSSERTPESSSSSEQSVESLSSSEATSEPSIPSEGSKESSSEQSKEESSAPSSSSSESSAASSGSSAPSGDVASPVSEDFLAFFDPANHSKVSIKASDEVLYFISSYQDSKGSKYADAYLPATITISFKGQDYVFEEAGIRMKGNTSRSSFFYDGRFTNIVHFKVSLKATFDGDEYNDERLLPFRHDWSEDSKGRKERKNRNFLGLEKFDLKYVPRNGGECTVREVYAYRAFAEQDLMSPYSTLVDMKLSSDHDSVSCSYQFIETIDKQFLKRRLSKSESAGDLYKCTYNGMGKADFTRDNAVDKSTYERVPYGKIGVEDTWNGYHPIYDLKTNEDLGEGADFSSMTNFIRTLWRCVYSDGTASELENVLDVQQFLSFSAVSYLLGNPDDQRYNYNNFYLYFRPSDGKAVFIPYDWDWCLGLDYTGNVVNLYPLDQWTGDGQTPSNVYLAALYGDKLSYAKNDYMSYVNDYVDDVLSISSFSSLASAFGKTEEVNAVSSYMNAKRTRVG